MKTPSAIPQWCRVFMHVFTSRRMARIVRFGQAQGASARHPCRSHFFSCPTDCLFPFHGSSSSERESISSARPLGKAFESGSADPTPYSLDHRRTHPSTRLLLHLPTPQHTQRPLFQSLIRIGRSPDVGNLGRTVSINATLTDNRTPKANKHSSSNMAATFCESDSSRHSPAGLLRLNARFLTN